MWFDVYIIYTNVYLLHLKNHYEIKVVWTHKLDYCKEYHNYIYDKMKGWNYLMLYLPSSVYIHVNGYVISVISGFYANRKQLKTKFSI